MNTTILLFGLTQLFFSVSAFSTSYQNELRQKMYDTSTVLFSTSNHGSRRSFLHKVTLGISVTTTVVSSTVAVPMKVSATLMDNNVQEIKTFKLGEKLSSEDAKKRFAEAMAEVDELIANYSEISQDGGDAVRRYLGTVGVEKKMYGISKVVKELRDEADDIVEYTELANEFEAYLYQAEGAAYQSLFVEHSSAKGTPASFLATAKKDIITMRKYMGELSELIQHI